MNQAIIFNDDLVFDDKEGAWCFTAQMAGQILTIYFHSMQLKQLENIDNCTKFDLEEVVELWLENNELEGSVININMR